ncbi:hypothetical protein LINPERPRIM_LOCUS21935 [Linum perenne]
MIIFGAALLFDETTPTFEWLLNTFEKCMRGKSQQVSSRTKRWICRWNRAIYPLPMTFRGLCTFHILNNAGRNLASLCDKVRIPNCIILKLSTLFVYSMC